MLIVSCVARVLEGVKQRESNLILNTDSICSPALLLLFSSLFTLANKTKIFVSI